MKGFFQLMLRFAAASSGAALTWLLSFFIFSQTFLFSSLYALAGGAVLYVSVKQIGNFRYLQKEGLTRRELKYIQKNLKEAKGKISRLQKALIQVRSLDQAKQNFEIIRTVRKIYSNTKKEPKRFYQAEGFYYKNLDSLVELTEKYAYLSSQPTKSWEMAESLLDTKRTVRSLNQTVKKDLHIMLKDDVDTLHFELDVAKQSFKKNDRSVLK
ncbi:protein xpaC [Virgibacillus profundi]|uniref:Protein xpaC n=1 Tax=Virgibacillus profundi TaxID=2024555 RepID=A0A2A2IGD7_9BACI|nr:5-bromo-4-chloroindolyl phosphate hydrolysis family protein [Virgibacillus profundi]PAV30829.1 protein xpaC [Virgibacillus profundi]PXY55012.1 protein xpaC [Virgibacillus profundi]